MTRIKGIEKENREAIRNNKKKDTKEKNRINAQKKTKAKTEERKTATTQPIIIHAYYIFYSFQTIYNIYYSSYHDQLVLLYTFLSLDRLLVSFLDT